MPKERHPGEKIRELRNSQQMSVADLAEKSRLSEAFIEQIETGRQLPSLAPLMKIARGLGVRLGAFLDDHACGGPAVIRGGAANGVVRFSGADASCQGSLDFYSLGADKSDRHMEPFLIDVHPALEEAPALSSHEGEEFIYVLKGSVTVAHGAERYVLDEGDSIYYDSVVPHEVRAAGNETARLLAVVFAPF